MTFVVDDCMDVVLGDAQLSYNVIPRYSSVCHDNVMNLVNGLMCGDCGWSSSTGVVFLTTPATVEFSIPILNHAV